MKANYYFHFGMFCFNSFIYYQITPKEDEFVWLVMWLCIWHLIYSSSNSHLLLGVFFLFLLISYSANSWPFSVNVHLPKEKFGTNGYKLNKERYIPLPLFKQHKAIMCVCLLLLHKRPTEQNKTKPNRERGVFNLVEWIENKTQLAISLD